jgi:hypothetical protein
MKITNILTSIALMSALTFGYKANAQEITPVKISTSTDIQQTSLRNGIRLHRTQLDMGDVTIKYDAKTNLNPSVSKDNLSDVGGIYVSNIIKKDNFNVGAGLTQLGNWDSKSQAVLYGWAELNYDQVKVKLEKGHSIRMTAPMEFDIVTVSNSKYSDNINAIGQVFLISNNGSMYNGIAGKDASGNNNKEFHGYLTVGNNTLTATIAEEEGTSHVLGMGKYLKDVGALMWLRTDRSKRDWALRGKLGFGNIDEKFFSYNTMVGTNDLFLQPQLYEGHLSPGTTRGDASLSLTAVGNGKTTSLELVPGIRTDVVCVGAGTYTEFKNNQSVTGLSGGVFKKFSVSGLEASVEVNYKSIGANKGFNAYVTTSYKF